jgi:Xaa-Pro dipeptidase
VIAMNLDEIQRAIREQGFDGWLFYDHHHRDPIAYRILGLSATAHVTRRWYYLIPAHGEPRKLVHRIESGRLDTLPGTRRLYSSWQELESELGQLLASEPGVPMQRIAMQYSPRNAIMYISLVDAGTIEVLREMGKTIVSSADLVSQFEAVLSEAQIASHYEAQALIDDILAEGFKTIGNRVRADGQTSEFAVVEWLSAAMRRAGLTWENGPNVSVNENSSDSHYEPTAANSKPIREGDFVLIDIWGRLDRPGTCFYDITWTGVVGRSPSPKELGVFEVVRSARDAAIQAVERAYRADEPIEGWQADDAARAVIRSAGYGDYFTHRTGHNIAAELHGTGAHLDNFETHDERLILPDTCFSVEPGIYLPEFGIRSEVNMITSRQKAVVTGRIQTELVRI